MTATLTRRNHRGAPDASIPSVWPEGATILDVFRSTVADHGARTALRHHSDGGWEALTWREYEQAVAEVALGLRAAGLRPGDRVAILSANRPEWHIVDIGALAAGGVSTPVYATSSSTQVAHVLRDSGARFVFVENGHQLAKVLLRRGELPDVEAAIVLTGFDGADDDFVRPLDDLRRDGAAARHADPAAFDDVVGAVGPEDLATLVYTSGTTGPPKGAMITHGNVMATLRSLTSLIELSADDRFLSFLPLSHITERSVSHFGQLVSGGETWFARSLVTVPDDLRACRPTLFFAVPRVWEKFHEAVLAGVEEAPAPMRRVLSRYLALATQRAAAMSTDGQQETWGTRGETAELAVLDATVGVLVRRKLGLDQARFLACGAAPVHPDLLRWFHAVGLPVAEGYGQTEVSLCTTLNPVDAIRLGTVGRPIPGVEVRIADDGEILVRGGGVCAGYWGRPDATAELIEPDGWLHSGDLGALDADGYLRVTGRKKDLIITAYGKNISPTEIETALRYEPLISEAVVVGDGRPFLTALLTIDATAAREWASKEGLSVAPDALVGDQRLCRAVAEAVERVNARHSHAEGIRRWRVLPHDLSVVAGELTPTLKVRREAVVAAHADLVEEMYAEP